MDTSGLSTRQALRVARGYPAGLRGDAERDEGPRVVGMGGHSGEWSGGVRRRDGGRSEIGGGAGKGMSVRSGSRGDVGDRGQGYHHAGGMGVGTSQLRAMVNEYATRGGRIYERIITPRMTIRAANTYTGDGAEEDAYSVD